MILQTYDIKAKFVAKGILADDTAYIHDAKSEKPNMVLPSTVTKCDVQAGRQASDNDR